MIFQSDVISVSIQEERVSEKDDVTARAPQRKRNK